MTSLPGLYCDSLGRVMTCSLQTFPHPLAHCLSLGELDGALSNFLKIGSLLGDWCKPMVQSDGYGQNINMCTQSRNDLVQRKSLGEICWIRYLKDGVTPSTIYFTTREWIFGPKSPCLPFFCQGIARTVTPLELRYDPKSAPCCYVGRVETS